MSPNHRPESVRIILLLEHDANCDRLAEWLSPTNEIIIPDGDPSNEEFDLCILDAPMLAKHRGILQTTKERAAPTFLPYVLVSTTTKPNPTSQVWDVVDEVISVPTQKATLHHRLINLLERRKLSKQLADDLHQQRELFGKIFESSNDAILVINIDKDTIRECNPQACELLGYTRTELRSLTHEDLHPDELPAFRAFVETVVENGHGWIDDLSCQIKTGTRSANNPAMEPSDSTQPTATTLLLLIESDRNRELLADRLSAEFAIETTDDDPFIDPEFDLCLLDTPLTGHLPR